MLVRSFHLPKFTYSDEQDFFNFIEDRDKESLQKKNRKLTQSDRGAAEYGFFEDWSKRSSLNPSAAHVSAITSASAESIVIVTPVNDNNNNIFYFQDLSSELVNASSVGGSTSYKAIPVCSLACSVSVDVLGLMHERTGHFNKRGLIECQVEDSEWSED